MRRSEADNLSAQQRTAIRHSDETALALARKYGVAAKTIEAVRLAAVPQRFVLGHDEGMATKKAAPKKRATKVRAATKADEAALKKAYGKSSDELADEAERGYDLPSVLGGPKLPRPLR